MRDIKFEKFFEMLNEIIRQENKMPLSGIGDPRVQSEEELKSLFEAKWFREFKTVDFDIHYRDRPENLMSLFMLMYNVAVISDENRIVLAQKFQRHLEGLADKDGEIEISMSMRQIVCRN
jgi:hypothetical protein